MARRGRRWPARAREDVTLTLGALADFVRGTPEESPPDPRCRWGPQWAGASREEAIRLGAEGWPAGVAMATAVSERLANKVIAATGPQSSGFIADVTGAGYDVGAYLSGEPECWLRFSEQAGRRAVRIGLCARASGGVPLEALMARGAAVMAIALLLQAHGQPVEVDVLFPCDFRPLKLRLADASSGSVLDLDRMAFGLVHPACYRILNRAYVNQAYPARHCIWGPQIPTEYAHPNEYDLYIGRAHLAEVDRWQGDAAERWVLEQYNKLATLT